MNYFKIIKRTIGILLVVLPLIWGCYYFYNNWDKQFINETKCGVVIDKKSTASIDPGRHHKFTILSQDIIYVKFDDGEIKRMLVDANTYYKNNKGDRVCFQIELQNVFYSHILTFISFVLSIASVIIIIGCLGLILVTFFNYLFN